MRRLVRDVSRAAGRSPAQLVHIGEQRSERVRVVRIDYNAEQWQEREIEPVAAALARRETEGVTWIRIIGLHDLSIVARIGEHFVFHPLLLEDAVNTQQRPKLDDYGDHLFVVLKLLRYDTRTAELEAEQVSIVVAEGLVVSFEEAQCREFDVVRDRIMAGAGRSRRSGADYLAYTLLDSVVDGYFLVLDDMGEQIELVEDGLVADANPALLATIHNLKSEVIFLRRTVWPVREVVAAIERSESGLVKPETEAFLRDLYDHTYFVIETVETFREMVSGMFDIYLSAISNRMNQIMQVLTIIATIFIPLTFITGIYGMNFLYMPELGWRFGYPATLLVMVVVALSMVWYFHRKRWI
jgi:magnesium transporter